MSEGAGSMSTPPPHTLPCDAGLLVCITGTPADLLARLSAAKAACADTGSSKDCDQMQQLREEAQKAGEY